MPTEKRRITLAVTMLITADVNTDTETEPMDNHISLVNADYNVLATLLGMQPGLSGTSEEWQRAMALEVTKLGIQSVQDKLNGTPGEQAKEVQKPVASA